MQSSIKAEQIEMATGRKLFVERGSPLVFDSVFICT